MRNGLDPAELIAERGELLIDRQCGASEIAAQRLHRGSADSARGAAWLTTDALALVRRAHLVGRQVLVRADSAFYSHALVAAVGTAGAKVPITMRMNSAVGRAIAVLVPTVWTRIKRPEAICDQAIGAWGSKDQVADVPFTAFSSSSQGDHAPGGWLYDASPTRTPKPATGRPRCSTPSGSTRPATVR